MAAGPADPKKAAETYLESNKIPQLFEALTASLLYNKPADPKAYIVKYLESVKLNGTPPLFSEVDLDAMFGMFDITNRGAITAEQANNALRSILGPSASLESVGIRGKALLTKDQFVRSMYEALRVAVPYTNGK